jgi:hypothetical protein
MGTKFHLEVLGLDEKDQSSDTVKVETRGILSSMGGLSILTYLAEITDPGSWLSPIEFQCTVEELEVIRQLLEESIQRSIDRDGEAKYDTLKSKLVVLRNLSREER